MITDLVLAALLGLGAVGIGVGLLLANRAPSNPVSLIDLLLGDDGRASKAAFVMFGAFTLSTWVIVYLTLNDKLTEGFFTIYVSAWVAPTVTRLIVGRRTDGAA